jgi:parvulin-like peptidyl-prolyl isomerase
MRHIFVCLLCLCVSAAWAQAPTAVKIKKAPTKIQKPVMKKFPIKGLKSHKTKFGKLGASKKQEAPLPEVKGKDGFIATVNGIGIPLATYQSKFDRFAQTFKNRNRPIPNKIGKRYRESIVKRLIEDELILQEAKRGKIKVAEADLAKEFKQYKDMFKEEKRFQRYLKTAKLNENQVKNNLRKSLLLKALMKKMGVNKVSDKIALDHYNKYKDRFKVKHQVRASHLLLKVKKDAAPEQVATKRKEIEGYLAQIKAGADFVDMVKKHSVGPAVRKGGDLGFFSKGRMVKEFDQKAFSMKVGDISEPIRTRFGWHLIKVTDEIKEKQNSFEDSKEKILKMLSGKAERQGRVDLLTKLRKKAKIANHLPK